MKKSNKTFRALFCAVFALFLLCGSIFFTSCTSPFGFETSNTSKLVLPDLYRGTDGYYINGTEVTANCWKTFVSNNFTDLNNVTFSSEYGEVLCFKVSSDYNLYFMYSGYGLTADAIAAASADFSDLEIGSNTPTCGRIIGVDTTVSDEKGGYVLLLEASHHTNSTYAGYESYCYGNEDKISDHTCYLPFYCNHFISSSSLTQGCYSETYDDGYNYACFEKVSDCLKHMAYSSDIYTLAVSYTKD